ncbi:MAG: response regulator, partial [Gallionella sp.]
DDRAQLGPEDRSILIIEDDQVFAKILLEHARSFGFKALVACDGKSGLALAHEHRPDAITLDLRLPDLDGSVVLERLKNDPETRHIPVQIISADALPDRTLPRMRRGAFAVLAKPVQLHELEEAFKHVREFVDKPVRRLLVVSDDPVQQAAIQELLAQPDIELVAVATGAQALGALAVARVDCIVLDMLLPDMSGLELLRELRTRSPTERIPSIVYTAAVLGPHEEFELRQLASSIILKDAASAERLLDETTLFLHRVESKLPESRRAVLRNLRESGRTLAGKRVLIVDDDVRNVFALTVLLEEQGMTVEYADNGVEALARLDTAAPFDIVLMDIMMPEMDGYEAMRHIRERASLQKLPIIALTAKAMTGDRKRCLDAGASDYIAKPVDPEQLVSLMRVWLYQ